jgi:hypothetical protein
LSFNLYLCLSVFSALFALLAALFLFKGKRAVSLYYGKAAVVKGGAVLEPEVFSYFLERYGKEAEKWLKGVELPPYPYRVEKTFPLRILKEIGLLAVFLSALLGLFLLLGLALPEYRLFLLLIEIFFVFTALYLFRQAVSAAVYAVLGGSSPAVVRLFGPQNRCLEEKLRERAGSFAGRAVLIVVLPENRTAVYGRHLSEKKLAAIGAEVSEILKECRGK